MGVSAEKAAGLSIAIFLFLRYHSENKKDFLCKRSSLNSYEKHQQGEVIPHAKKTLFLLPI